jgi:hypothetical protein
MVWKALGQDDFTTRPAGPRAVVELVRPCIRWEDDVAGGENVDLLAVAAFGDIESSGALGVRRGSGSDRQTECGGERTAKAGGLRLWRRQI